MSSNLKLLVKETETQISAPESLFDLSEQLDFQELFYRNIKGELIELRSTKDYLKMLDYAEKNNLVELLIELCNENSLSKKVSKQTEKFENKFLIGESNLLNYDEDLNKDLRNPKKQRKYTKQGKNLKNLVRIYYVKEKKTMQEECRLKRLEEKNLKDTQTIQTKKDNLENSKLFNLQCYKTALRILK